MSDNQYPVFVDGQTLTEAELNDLRAFLHQRDRLVGRMVGFGVNAGLAGVVTSSTTLTISPGLAIDQTGEPLVLETSATIPLPPVAESVAYDFVSAAPGGFSVVLEATDTIEPSPACGESGCAGHAELHTRAVALHVVAGRVTGTRMDFAAEPLLTVEPIRLSLDSTPVNSYTALRNAVATRLANGTQPLVDTGLIAKLQATSIAAADTAGIRGYKCGWLNMVLFATLDLLRVRALLSLTSERTTTRPGVVLGWVHEVSGAWVFDCAWRHAWEPPRGFTEAFLGGTCSDPAGAFRDELEALLAGFAPPDPAPVGDPKPPIACPVGSIRVGDRCIKIKFPPKDIPDTWHDKWIFDPRAPIWYPPIETWKDPDKVYERQPVDVLGEKEFPLTDYLGHNGADVKDVLGGFITEQGAIADVRVMAASDVQTLEGYAPAGGFAASDSVVLGVDASGVVVSTGRVPTVQNVRTVGSALPAAVGAANEAMAAATELRGLSTGFEARFTELDQTIAGLDTNLTTLQTDFLSYKTSFDPGGFGDRVGALEEGFKEIEGVRTRVNVLEGKVDVISKLGDGIRLEPRTGIGDVVGGAGGGGILTGPGGIGGVIVQPSGQIDRELAQGIADFARTTVDALRSLPKPRNRSFSRYAAAADRAHAALADAVAPAEAPEAPEGAERAVAEVPPADAATITAAAMEVLSTIRTLVKASGISKDLGKQLDAQLRDLGRRLP
jgi:hypothetical protein